MTRLQANTFNRIFGQRVALAGLTLALGIALVGCPRPAISPAQITSVFTIGTVALETGDERALQKLTEASKLAPEEPAIWANIGLVHLRKNQLDLAAENLKKASDLMPTSAEARTRSDLEALLSVLAKQKGDVNNAVAHQKRAVELLPDDLIQQYALGKLYVEINDDAAALETFRKLAQRLPDNLEVWLQTIWLAAKRNDKQAYKEALDSLNRLQKHWPERSMEQLTALRTGAPNLTTIARYAVFLRNTLKSEFEWHHSYAEVNLPLDANDIPVIGKPLERFAKLPNAPDTPAAPDMAIRFTPTTPYQTTDKLGPKDSRFVAPFWANNTGNPGDPIQPYVMYFGRKGGSGQLHIEADAFRAAASSIIPPGTPGIHGLLALDFDYDLRADLLFATPQGLKLYLQPENGKFIDATAAMKLPADILRGSYVGAWGLDYDSDGDLDILLARTSGPPLILRNNGDGSFLSVPIFKEVEGVRDFAWADLDGDGTCDAILLDASGTLHVYINQRGGKFISRPLPANLDKFVAITAADINHDGKLDIIALKQDGTPTVIWANDKGDGWNTESLPAWPNHPTDFNTDFNVDSATILVADLDNNGSLDIVASSKTQAMVWLNDGTKLTPLPNPIPAQVLGAADLDGKGRIDLLGVDASGQPTILKNQGTKNYFWQDIRPRANEGGEVGPSHHRATAGAASLLRRINSFGIGGEIDIRSGLLYQKHLISSPSVHVGLGEYPTLDVARILWPNGDVRAEFEVKGGGTLSAAHRVGFSCPFLFTWNGSEMEFVTDCIWRSPVGLKINSVDTAGVQMTEDWVKIRGEQLLPRPHPAYDDGVYDLRITAELWETHFFDHLALMTVDHPADVEIFCDERFAVPPPPLRIYATTPPRPVKRVWDDEGNDVTEIVAQRDGRYIANFPPGSYPGVTRDHWIEMEFDAEVPFNAGAPVYLIANGWIWPTNSSVNVALSQGDHPIPTGISLETPDAQGVWQIRKRDLGFPAGKVKHIVLRIDDLFEQVDTELKMPRRLRLRTNLEIYWDSLQWAVERPDAELKVTRIDLNGAELRYRGFSQIERKDERSPELPLAYEMPPSPQQKWRDLTGYYTAFGDVLPLLREVDDRYVIMNAGDELRLTFPVPPPSDTKGWRRDFVLVGDGWVKDGNYNTTYSKTVHPHPAHDLADSDLVLTTLEDDAVYQRHPSDWQEYHTRYVTTDRFRNALRPYCGRIGIAN